MQIDAEIMEGIQQTDEKKGTVTTKEKKNKRKKKINAYPSNWSDSFGNKYYECLVADNEQTELINEWVSDESGTVYIADDTNVTTSSQAASEITSILKDIGAYDE